MNRKPVPQHCPATGKQQYSSLREAQDVAMAFRKQPNGGKDQRNLCAYLCRACGKWHLGRKRKLRLEEEPQQPKPLSPGQVRRKMEHEQREAERHAKRAALFSDYLESVRYANALLDKEIALTTKAAGGKS
jgi:hypothetical protein